MNYKIDVSAPDLSLIGEALDLLPHGRVSRLSAAIQEQINQQEAAERARSEAAQADALASWRARELDNLKSELAKCKAGKTRKGK